MLIEVKLKVYVQIQNKDAMKWKQNQLYKLNNPFFLD